MVTRNATAKSVNVYVGIVKVPNYHNRKKETPLNKFNQ